MSVRFEEFDVLANHEGKAQRVIETGEVRIVLDRDTSVRIRESSHVPGEIEIYVSSSGRRNCAAFVSEASNVVRLAVVEPSKSLAVTPE